MPSYNRSFVAAQILLGHLLCIPVSAMMVPLATTSLVDHATSIVEGRVTSLRSRWTDDHSSIVTEVRLDVVDVLLGETNSAVFFHEGGAVGGVEQRVSDMPRFEAGQHVLVFLRPPTDRESRRDRIVPNKGKMPVLMSAAQGVWRIDRGRAVKDGFTVAGDDSVIDRNLDLQALKMKVRQRMADTRRESRTP
jgi:hypothetical protein